MKLLFFGFAMLAFTWSIEEANSSCLHNHHSRKMPNTIIDNDPSFNTWYKQRRASESELKSEEGNDYNESQESSEESSKESSKESSEESSEERLDYAKEYVCQDRFCNQYCVEDQNCQSGKCYSGECSCVKPCR